MNSLNTAVFCVISRPPRCLARASLSAAKHANKALRGSQPRLLLLHLGAFLWNYKLAELYADAARVRRSHPAGSGRQVSTLTFNLPRADKYITVVRVMYAAVKMTGRANFSVTPQRVEHRSITCFHVITFHASSALWQRLQSRKRALTPASASKWLQCL